nr:MAG TPA: hypothetical protein [Caudoviricetes sp.]
MHAISLKKLATNSTCVTYIGMIYLYHSKEKKSKDSICYNIY